MHVHMYYNVYSPAQSHKETYIANMTVLRGNTNTHDSFVLIGFDRNQDSVPNPHNRRHSGE